MQRPEASLSLFLAFLLAGCAATNPSATSSPAADSATFDSDGTAHITRVVPMPATISPEARKWLQSLEGSNAAAETLEVRRKRTDEWRAKQSAEARRLFPVNVEETTHHHAARNAVREPKSRPHQSSRRRLQLRFGLAH